MEKIYVGQTKLRIQLDTNQNVADSTLSIKYEKPSGETGTWTATQHLTDNTIIYYDVTTGDLDEAGRWKFWSYVVFSDTKIGIGEPVTIYVYNEGE